MNDVRRSVDDRGNLLILDTRKELDSGQFTCLARNDAGVTQSSFSLDFVSNSEHAHTHTYTHIHTHMHTQTHSLLFSFSTICFSSPTDFACSRCHGSERGGAHYTGLCGLS